MSDKIMEELLRGIRKAATDQSLGEPVRFTYEDDPERTKVLYSIARSMAKTPTAGQDPPSKYVLKKLRKVKLAQAENPKTDTIPTKPLAWQPGSPTVEPFEELLKLDPKDVSNIRVLPRGAK